MMITNTPPAIFRSKYQYTLALVLCFIWMGVFFNACQKSSPRFKCTDSIGCVDIAPGEPFKIGVLQTLSGGSAPGGTEQARTIELVIAQQDNQLLDHPIEIKTEDERCSSEGGANAALRILADPQVIAIFGTNCSGAAVTAGKLMSEAGMVMISSSNTAPSLTSIGGNRGENWYPGYFRTSWNDANMGQAAATFAFRELGLTKAAVIHAGDPYTKGLTEAFSHVFTGSGGEIVLETAIDVDDPDLHPTLTAVQLSGAELMFFPIGQPETSSRLVQQSRKLKGLEHLVLFGGEGMMSEIFIETVGQEGVGVYLTGPATVQSASNDALRAEYELRYGEAPPSFYYSFTHDAVNLLFMAIRSVVIREQDGTLHIGRQALRDALYASTGFDGLTGRLVCDEFGDCGATHLNVVRLDDPTTGIEGLRANVIYTYTPE